MSSIHRNPAYKEGMDSYSNDGNYKNPYAPGSPDHNAFERGWSQALKRSPKRVGRNSTFAYIPCAQIKLIENLDLKKAKEAYLKSKGD